MDNDPTVKDGVEKKTDELGNEQEIEQTSGETFGDATNDGFGSLSHELEGAEASKSEDETTDAGTNTDGATESTDAEKKDEPEAAGPVVASNVEDEKKKKSKKRTIILVVVLVLVLIGCGVAAFFILNPKEERKEDIKPVDEPAEEISEFRLKDNGLNDFDLKIMKLNNESKNLIYSPLSIKYALAMLKDGADGETKKQIDDIIGDYKSKKYINSKNLSLANAMFIRNEYKNQVLDSYIAGLKKDYNAEVIFDSFQNANAVNGWVKNKTLNLIDKFMDDKDANDVLYLLVNALAIDQQWVYQLQCQDDSRCNWGNNYQYKVTYPHEKIDEQYIPKLTISDYQSVDFGTLKNRKAVKIGASFNRYDIMKEVGEEKIKTKVTEEYKKWLKSEDGQMEIQNYKEYPQYFTLDPEDVDKAISEYMSQLKSNFGRSNFSTDFYLNDTEDAKVFAKNLKEYDGTTLQYVGIMPKEKELKSYVDSLTAKDVTKLIGDLKELKAENFEDGVITRIDATIPIFKFGNSFSLKKNLEEIGIKDVFSKKDADLSKMTKEEDAHIDIAIHSATIDFNNDGIRASAVTAMGGLGGGAGGFEYEWDVPVKKIDLSFNKPFLYLIRDTKSGEIWFAGTVYEPLEMKKN